MTINIADNDPRNEYTVADGNSQTVFTMTYEIFDNADLNVYVDGTLQTLTTHYKISDSNSDANAGHTSGSDGFVHFTSAVTASGADKKIVLTRSIDLERTTDFPASGAFQIASLNTELDKLIAIQADLKDDIDRSLRLTDFDLDATLTLPAVNSRKGTVLAFNSSTGAVEAGPQSTDVNQLADITDDIATLADIEDGTDATDAIQTVAGISANVTTVAGVSANVTTVAGISANVTSVAGDAVDIGKVAAIDSDVTSVAAVDSDVTTVAGISANVTTVAGDSADIQALAAKTTELGLLGTADAISDMNTLATSPIVTDMDALADLTTEIDALGDVTADISTVAGIQANVTTVANNDANITEVANNISGVNSFGERYRVSANAPTTSLDSGDLWFDTTNNLLKVYGGSGFQNSGASVNGTSERQDFVVGTSLGSYTGSTTTFPVTYDAGFVDVYLNGIKLQPADFTSTSGTEIVLASAAQTNDTLSLVAYGTFDIANFSLNDATDVTTSGITDGQVLAYNNSTSDFRPTTISATSDLVDDTTPQLGGDLDTNGNAIQFGSSKWTIELDGNNLLFKYNGTAKIKFADDGEIVTVDDVTAFGTI